MINSKTNKVETPRLLVVDDDESIRNMLVWALTRAGYTVETADDGVDGLTMLRANKYDLLICDNQMPRLSGLELLKQIQSERISLPIIMASGTLQQGDLADQGIPPLMLLSKPFLLVDLLSLIKKSLANDGADRGTGTA